MVDKERFGIDTPLYDCTECGDQTVIPAELETDGVIELECPTCGNESLTYVDELCRFGRTVSPHESACYNEWAEVWERPNLSVRLCEEHHDEFTSPLPLPDGAIGRCDSEDCTIAVWEKTDGKLLCESCRNNRSSDTDNED